MAHNSTPGASNPYAIMKIADGMIYIANDGKNFDEASELTKEETELFDFSTQFSKFEFKDGAYTLKDGETATVKIGNAYMNCTPATVKFNEDSKITYLAFTGEAGYRISNVVFEFSSYGTTTKPSMSGGDSSNPQIHKPPIATNGAEVTQKQWSEAFRPANVTVYTCADTSEGIMVALGIICDGKTYSSEDGVNFTEDEETPEDIYADMPFSTFYDKFEYHDGTYVLKSGESILHSVENDITTVLKDVSIMFNEEGQIVRINYSIYATKQGHPEIPVAEIESIFFDHGETSAPEIGGSTDGDEGSGNTNIPDNNINENETERSEIPAVSTGSLK